MKLTPTSIFNLSFIAFLITYSLYFPAVSCFLAFPTSLALPSASSHSSPPPSSSSQDDVTCLHQSRGSSDNSNFDGNGMAPTSTAAAGGVPRWFQHELSITAPSRGCHLITSQVTKTIGQDLANIRVGMCNLFIQHTSASLTINENADPDVRRDMEVALNRIVPAEWNRDGTFRHTMEGDDDMPVSQS